MSYIPNVVIIDSHLIFRQGLISVIKNEHIASIMSEASSGYELSEILKTNIPDLVLMDIDVPDNSGVDAIRKAIECYPALRFIVYSTFEDQNFFHELISMGVKGFILKSGSINDLEYAIRDVMAGRSHFSALLLERIKNNFNRKAKRT